MSSRKRIARLSQMIFLRFSSHSWRIASNSRFIVTKELPIYALVVATRDRGLGPGLIESKEGSCTRPGPSVAPLPNPSGSPKLGCGQMMASERGITAVSIRIADLPLTLSRLLRRTVVDNTGLAGEFDIKVEWTPDDTLDLRTRNDLAPPPSNAAVSSIINAFEEQLGIKIESQKGPVEILVVDKAEKPSEN